MWPDRVSNPGPLTYESGALPIALRGPAKEVPEKFEHGAYALAFQQHMETRKKLGLDPDSF